MYINKIPSVRQVPRNDVSVQDSKHLANAPLGVALY